MNHFVEFKNIRKVFHDAHSGKDHIAVQNFSLQIQRKEFVTILGPSGCGKTTVLRMLAGFETPSDGEIQINGERMNERPPDKRNLAMVFQSYALFPHMNVEENISYGLKLRKIAASERMLKLRKALEIMNLVGLEKRRPHELSGGQQQRVALARALVIEPELILFDEPLSNLDAKLRESMRVELKNLQRRLGITSVYVTHDQTEAMALSDRIVVMNKGEIEQIDSPPKIYTRPATTFVADFFGAANFLDGVIKNTGPEKTEIEAKGFQLQIPSIHPNKKRGDRVTVIARPESIQLNASSKFTATVQTKQFLGSHWEYQLEMENGMKLLARIPLSESEIPVDLKSCGIQLDESQLHFI